VLTEHGMIVCKPCKLGSSRLHKSLAHTLISLVLLRTVKNDNITML